MKRNIIIIAILLIISGCASEITNFTSKDAAPKIYPDYTDIVIPVNIAPLNFKAENGTLEMVEVSTKQGVIKKLCSNGKLQWKLSEWKEMIANNIGDTLRYTVYISDSTSNCFKYKPFYQAITPDSIDSYVAYRNIETGYVFWLKMGLYQRSTETFDCEPIIENSAIDKACINCHSFCKQSPDKMLFHSRKFNPGTLILWDGKLQKYNTKTDSIISGGVYSAWNPNGYIIAMSVNKIGQRFHNDLNKRIYVSDSESDIVIMNMKTETVSTCAANPVDCNTLQSIANSLQPEFVDDLCKPGTVWMQKVFANDIPEYLPLYIRSLFKPIQVPEGSKLKMEVPAIAVGILAALGAIIGAWVVGLFAWTGGMKQPGDMTTLLGATVGAGLFSWLIFWATANETVRKTLEYAVGTVAVVDAAATVASYFINFGSFFGAKKTIQGGFFKRLLLYAACWFVLHLMKRPVVFDRQDYKNKLEALYFERIQSIVLFLASCSSISENDRKVLNDEQNRWAKKVEDQEADIKAQKLGNKYISIMYPCVRSLWNLDIRQLEPQLRSLAQDFITLGFDLPKSERMHFAEQLDALIQKGTEVLPEKPKPVKQEPRRFIWNVEFKEQFNRIGLIDPGEEVVVLDEPVLQNGKVIKKGNVQSSEDYSEL